MRHIGQNPTEAEIQVWDTLEFNCYCDDVQEMLETADKDGTGTLDIIEFLQMMREKVKEQNKEKEISEAFDVFDVVSNACEHLTF